MLWNRYANQAKEGIKIMWILFSIFLGFVIDWCIGDPYCIPHPVVWVGKGISKSEKLLRKIFPQTSKGELKGGIVIAVLIPVMSFFISSLILFVAYKISFVLWFILNTFWAYQIPASRCLCKESKKVYNALKEKDLSESRKLLSWLVGRDTSNLTEEEVTKACVETVAENTSDGITAPLLYMIIGGVPLGFFYKAVNTLDSMIGYRNEKYEYFGKASATLDDIMNWLPSRICGIFMIISAWMLKLDFRQSFKVFKRDRKNHLSPNSAQTESAVAGALGIQLGGTHIYFGKTVEKPTIGDNKRKAEPDDIIRTNQIMAVTSILSMILFGVIRLLFYI